VIAHGIRWPSIQAASELLRRRLAAELHARELRKQLESQFERKTT
jgi:hypothetical protein